MTLRLGIIGMSEGNGHPYSWPAICNGYDKAAMDSCGFPVIPSYLAEQRFPEDFMSNVAVTHVWTQDRDLSRHIAKAAYIETVVDRFPDMIGHVDGILLARDDAETHQAFAAPFLEAGLPVYIDKPLALSRAAAEAILGFRKYCGQVFSCSALRYAKELELTQDMRESIGNICFVQASVPKGWDKYAIHVIEPIFNIVGHTKNIIDIKAQHFSGIENVTAIYEGGLIINIIAFGNIPAPISIKIYGDKGNKELIFKDSFNAFKSALVKFTDSIVEKEIKISDMEMLNVVDLIESGRQCLQSEQ